MPKNHLEKKNEQQYHNRIEMTNNDAEMSILQPTRNAALKLFGHVTHWFTILTYGFNHRGTAHSRAIKE